MTNKPFRHIGSVSHGTMRPEDIGPACLDVAREILGSRKRDKRTSEIMLDAHRANRRDWQGEYDSEILQDLMDLLSELAPPYLYFGANEGDGSDFGFWPLIERMEEDVRDEALTKVSDLSELPRGFRGEVMIVNDHGNVMFGVMRSRGFREIWSCV